MPPVENNGYLKQRYMLSGDFHLGNRFRVFAELQSGFVNFRSGGPRPIVDKDKLDVNQAFVDVNLGLDDQEKPTVTLRVGRQELHLEPAGWSRSGRCPMYAPALMACASYLILESGGSTPLPSNRCLLNPDFLTITRITPKRSGEFTPPDQSVPCPLTSTFIISASGANLEYSTREPDRKPGRP